MDHNRARVLAIVESLCSVPGDRRPGSEGNAEAVAYVHRSFVESGWTVATPEFDCLDWSGGEATARVGELVVPIVASPYGMGVDTMGTLQTVSSIDEIHQGDLEDSVAVITGELASEPLTPKAFPFYGSDAHTAIVNALEAAQPAVIIAVTGKYPELCGALDPFPWIEDGDFEIPVASVRPNDAGPLLSSEGHRAAVTIDALRIPSRARNVVAGRGPTGRRITVCAHIDAKPGTPGAVDNATGVATLLLLAEILSRHQELPIGVELLAVNGEDHFAAPGEVAWLNDNHDTLDDIALFANVDGAGYRQGGTAYSFYNVGEGLTSRVRREFSGFDDLSEGPQWFQSDHAIFAMQGRPAMAFTTEFVQQMLAELFHSELDTVAQVDPDRIVNLAGALHELIMHWPTA